MPESLTFLSVYKGKGQKQIVFVTEISVLNILPIFLLFVRINNFTKISTTIQSLRGTVRVLPTLDSRVIPMSSFKIPTHNFMHLFHFGIGIKVLPIRYPGRFSLASAIAMKSWWKLTSRDATRLAAHMGGALQSSYNSFVQRPKTLI